MSDTEFSRPLRVEPMPRGGFLQDIEANAGERAALAKLNGLPAIERLSASVHVDKWGRGVRVEGRLAARVTRVCVVSLEPFEVDIDEPIEVKFLPPDDREAAPTHPARGLDDEDAPDPLIGGVVDIGAIASEFLTLALDPYPRKPGVEYEPPGEPGERDSPFSGLRALSSRDEPD